MDRMMKIMEENLRKSIDDMITDLSQTYETKLSQIKQQLSNYEAELRECKLHLQQKEHLVQKLQSVHREDQTKLRKINDEFSEKTMKLRQHNKVLTRHINEIRKVAGKPNISEILTDYTDSTDI